MGAYTVQYVDLSRRTFTFSGLTANTLNAPNSGSKISITVSIIYKINDPSLLLENSNPLEAFLNTCAGAIKNFIITHRYDELIGKHEDESFIPDNQIIQHIKEQVAFTESCNAFWIRDVKIIERLGDQEINNLRHKRLVQANQSLNQKEKTVQQQEIATEEKILAETKAEQDRSVGETKALADANRSEILKQARILDARLDIMRRNPDLQQDRALKIIEMKKQAIESLFQLYTISGFPRDASDIQLMEKILESLADAEINTPELSLEESTSVNDLSSTIINLISPKNKP
jgi:LAS superfamily LD-carboxypeptidase LdcB